MYYYLCINTYVLFTTKNNPFYIK